MGSNSIWSGCIESELRASRISMLLCRRRRLLINAWDKLGMEMAIAGSPGWSETGGPWVPPSEGMKKYVWSETLLEGGKNFSGKLAHPPSSTGAFQNMGIREAF